MLWLLCYVFFSGPIPFYSHHWKLSFQWNHFRFILFFPLSLFASILAIGKKPKTKASEETAEYRSVIDTSLFITNVCFSKFSIFFNFLFNLPCLDMSTCPFLFVLLWSQHNQIIINFKEHRKRKTSKKSACLFVQLFSLAFISTSLLWPVNRANHAFLYDECISFRLREFLTICASEQKWRKCTKKRVKMVTKSISRSILLPFLF